MIRTVQPVPNMLRLRIRAHVAADQASRRADGAREGLRTSLGRNMAVLRRIPHVRIRRAFVRAVTHRSQEVSMRQFETYYQRLIDLLCWSAREGVHPEKQDRYAEIRAWFMEHYERFRVRLLPHLSGENSLAEDEVGCRARDAFESLFLPPSLETVINADNVILRIMETRTALDACLDGVPEPVGA